MYVCMYINIYACIYMYTYTYILVLYLHIYTHIYVHVHVCVCVCVCVCIHIYRNSKPQRLVLEAAARVLVAIRTFTPPPGRLRPQFLPQAASRAQIAQRIAKLKHQ